MVLTTSTRAVAAVALLVAGVLLHTASWQRWAGACTFPSGPENDACDVRQDHLYDFLVVVDPWQPIGTAAEQAGVAFLLIACALLLAPWALIVVPGPYVTVWLVVAALAYVGVGTATLRSGLSGEVVAPLMGNAAFILWFWVPTPVIAWAAVRACGWTRAAAVFLFLASPLVMVFSYAIGPYDANPWYEAYSGDLTALAGLCLLVAAVRPLRAVQPAADWNVSARPDQPTDPVVS